MNQTALIAALESAPGIIIPLVREAPRAILKLRPAPDRWSIHEHACHLAVVHPLFFSRLELILNNPHPRIAPYEPEMEEEGLLMRMDIDDALERFQRDRARLIALVRMLAPDHWDRTAEHEEYSRYSVFIMIRHIAMHDMLHGYRIEQLVFNNDYKNLYAEG